MKGCCSTALAATNYPNDFSTAHSLLCIPVEEEHEKDVDDDCIKCNLYKNPQRRQLLNAMSTLIWDEFPSNHRECFEAVYDAMNEFKGKVVVCAGDFQQILPVVVNGDKDAVLQASIFSSSLWALFDRRYLTRKMRLESCESMNEADQRKQTAYGKILDMIGMYIFFKK